MSPIAAGFASLGALLVLLALRVPIAVALGGVAILGIAFLRDFSVAFGVIEHTPFEFMASWNLSAIPMFLVMGAIAHHSGISAALFRAARVWLSWMPGGLAVATNFACAGFAAASGSSMATAAAMGRIAIPEMLRNGYQKELATGVVASAGTLGSLIPPSILFILYGIFAEVSIVKLLIAGILPGLLTAALYGIMIVGRCALDPKLAPQLDRSQLAGMHAERWAALASIWPLMLLVLGIIGGLYTGVFTPTEAGAAGAFLAVVIAVMQRRLTLKAFFESVMESVETTARIFFVAVGAIMYTKFLALTGLPFFLRALIGTWALDPLLLVIAASLIYVILGMFIDTLGVLLLTLPILLPMFERLGLDPIWLGVIVVKYLEIGLLTPPVGFNVYVIKSVVGDEISLETIFRGVGWFLGCEVVIMVLLIAFPEISTYLPSRMG